MLEERIKQRVVDLIERSSELKVSNSHGQARSDDQVANCKGWLAAALNIIDLVSGGNETPYKLQFQNILNANSRLMIPKDVGAGSAILSAMLIDIESGLISSVANMARAETFDNFLDHAKAYHAENMKNESGVIAGVVFEDSIRRVCDKFSIPQSGVKLDELISQLAKASLISQTKAKRARVAAHVRTKATHAQWDEFELDDVGVTIDFTEEFILRNLE